jgi:hypothetical protein
MKDFVATDPWLSPLVGVVVDAIYTGKIEQRLEPRLLGGLPPAGIAQQQV